MVNPEIERVIDQCGLAQFTNAMWERLEEMRHAGKSGWYTQDSATGLSSDLLANCQPGCKDTDLVDAANLLMMLWANKYEITV